MYLPTKKERENLNNGLTKDGEKIERRGTPTPYVAYYGKKKQRYQHVKPINRIVGNRRYIKMRLAELDLISWFDYKLYRLLPDGTEIPSDFSREELIKMMLFKKKR